MFKFCFLKLSSFKNEITMNKVKALLNNFLFDGPLKFVLPVTELGIVLFRFNFGFALEK